MSDNEHIEALGTAGLDKQKISECLASDAFKSQVEADLAYGDSLRVNGTPTLFLDGKRIDMSAFGDKEVFITFLDNVLTK